MTDEQYLECSRKVLEFIADDNPYNLEVLKELLRKETPGFNLFGYTKYVVEIFNLEEYEEIEWYKKSTYNTLKVVHRHVVREMKLKKLLK
jgi:uncharacterized protein YfeS